jgi:hypothetical protein
MNRITILAAAGALVATPVVGAWSAFAASGDNAPSAAHVRLASDRRGEPEPGDDHGRHHHRHDDGRHHHRHGSDVRAAQLSRATASRVVDDHGRHAEPGDDHGRHAEPGDDRGRHHGGDDGGHHGSGHR